MVAKMLTVETDQELIIELSEILNTNDSFICVLSAEETKKDGSYKVKYVIRHDTFAMHGDAWARYGGTIYDLRVTTVDIVNKTRAFNSGHSRWTEELVKLFKRKPAMSPRGLWFMKSTSTVIATHNSLIFVENRYPMGD